MIFLKNGIEKNYVAGSLILKSGETSDDNIYYILNGMVEQRIDGINKKIYSERLIAHHLFGLVTPYANATHRIETAKAISPVKAYVWKKDEFLKIASQSLKLVALTIQDLSKQLREMNNMGYEYKSQKAPDNAPNALGMLLESR